MAKFVFEFDSETKQLVVTADGTPLDNVRDVMFYGNNYDGLKKWQMCVMQSQKNEDGTRTIIQTTAATAENLQEVEATQAGNAQAGASESPAAILARLFAKN